MISLNYAFLTPGHKVLGYVQIGLFLLCYFFNFVIFLFDIIRKLKQIVQRKCLRKRPRTLGEMYHIRVKGEDKGIYPAGSRARQNYLRKKQAEEQAAATKTSSNALLKARKANRKEKYLGDSEEIVLGRRNAIVLDEDEADWRLNVIMSTRNGGLL